MRRLVFLAILASSPANAAPQFDYCAAVARSSPEATTSATDEAISYVSERLNSALDLYRHAGRVVGSAARPFPLGQPGEGRSLRTQFFQLTVLHWIAVKQGLCACPARSPSSSNTCEQLEDEIRYSCQLEPRRLHGINIRCLTKGR